MVAEARAFQNGSADLDIGCDSILPMRIGIFPAAIRYVQYPTDHTHLRSTEKGREGLLIIALLMVAAQRIIRAYVNGIDE